MPFKVVSQKSFLKGLVASMNRFSMPKGAIGWSSNLLLTERGALVTCDGTMAIAQGTTRGPVLEIGIYVDPTTFNITPIIGSYAGNQLDISSFGLTPVNPLVPQGTINMTSGWLMPQFVNFAGVTIISVGNEYTPYEYTAPNSFAQLTANTSGPSGGAGWEPNTYYSVGQRIVATDSNGKNATWQVVNVTVGSSAGTMANATPVGGIGGQSGSTEPDFASAGATTGTGETVADNQVIWMLIKEDANFGKEAVPAGAAHIINHAAALWAWNTAPTTQVSSGTPDGPSVLRMSAPNNPNSWPLSNSIFIGKDDGTQGTGIATFTVAEAGISPTGSLVCFKDYSTYQVIGVFQAQDFAVNEVKSDMGCLAGRSVAFATGFGVIRFCHLGFALFDGVNDRLISEEIRPFIFGTPSIAGVDFTRLGYARGTLTTNPPLYVCTMPTTDGNLTRIFCYDLVMRAWMVVDYLNAASGFPITAMNQVRPPISTGYPATTWLGDNGPAGVTIRRWQAGDTTWDANDTPVNWGFRCPIAGEPGSRAYFRRANVRLKAPQPGTLTAMFKIGDETQPNNIQDEGGAGPSSGMPPNVLTTTNYDGDEDLGVAMDIHQTGPTISGTFTGSGPATIEGVDYHVVAKQPRPFGQRF